jgi:hypothetical protein
MFDIDGKIQYCTFSRAQLSLWFPFVKDTGGGTRCQFLMLQLVLQALKVQFAQLQDNLIYSALSMSHNYFFFISINSFISFPMSSYYY